MGGVPEIEKMKKEKKRKKKMIMVRIKEEMREEGGARRNDMKGAFRPYFATVGQCRGELHGAAQGEGKKKGCVSTDEVIRVEEVQWRGR